MSKNNKGLVSDILPKDQPADTYPFAKNGIQNNLRATSENEPGFRRSSANIPYGTTIGIIETDKMPVIFSTNNVNSAIGYFNDDDDVYTPILDDANLPFKLGFNTENYITGTAQRNYLAQVVIAFTDKNPPPRYLNCDAPNIKAPEDLLLFPVAQAPDINVTTDVGGSLAPGAYFAAARYLKNDGTQTSFLVESGVTIIPGDPNTLQNIQLVITLSNIDPNFDLVEIAIISKVNGKFDQQLMDAVQLSEPTTISYSGANPTTSITLAEILQNAVVYNKIGCIGQLNDYLYVANCEAPQEIVMQQYVNLIQVRWKSELHTVFPTDPIITSGTKTSFMHREVYCLYAQFSLATGGWTRAFAMPGRPMVGTDFINSPLAAAGGMNTKRFQTEDTIPSFNPTDGTGEMGGWQNATELYPDTIDFDSSAIGGENLRGKPVRHHRFPSIRWCKQNLYQFEPTYGKTKLDILGLQISNVIIPAQYTNQITGYRILYAKRNSGNSTVIAQSLYMEGGRSQHGYLYDPTTQAVGGPLSNYLWGGGNWFAEVNVSTADRHRPIYPDPRIMRFHAFDLLLNQPSVSPSYICNELKMKVQNLSQDDSYMEDGDLFASNDGPIVMLIDYIVKGNTPIVSPDDKVIRKVVNSTYVPCNLVTGVWNNTQMEGCLGMTINGPELLHLGTTPNPADDPTSEFSYMKLILHKSSEPPANVPQFENTYLTNLMFLRDELYNSFASQDLVIANSRVNGTAPSTIFGGDTFINDYTFNTYGWIDANNDGYTGINQPATGGIRVARRFACEAASNIALRFIAPGSDYSKYYPKSPLVKNDVTNYLTLFNRTNDPNQFGYTKDSNTLNELVTSTIFTPLVDTVYQFPYRIHRGGFLDRLNKRRNWRSFDPLDFYEMQKNMGIIQFIDGMDDRLLIHCEKALFRTQDKTKLESALIAITLGAGDIFQFQPQEAMSSKQGYGGTLHDLACVRTPIGYIFIDAPQGQVFMLKNELKLINEGINVFLRDALRMTDKNVFTGNGFTIGYDPYYKRILLTSKNQQLLSSTVKPIPFLDTPEFIATLTPGKSIVIKDGRLQLFLGINSTPYSCDMDLIPIVQDYTITVPDNTPVGTQVLQVAGINTDDFYILSGNVSNAFGIEAATGKLVVNGPLDFQTLPQYILQCKAINDDRFYDLFTITINLLSTIKPPRTGDQEIHIPEHSLSGYSVAQVQGVDPKGLPLTFTIVSGNTDNAFAIDGTGLITVLTSSAIDFATRPQYVLVVAVSNGTFTVNANITIDIDYVNTPPSSNDVIVTILDTTPNGTEIVDLSQAVIDSGVTAGLQSLSFQAIDPIPGTFGINLITGAVTVEDSVALNAQTTPQYIVSMRAIDNGNPPMSSFFRLIINVIYDPATIAFAPAGGSCSGGSCPAGWNLSPDGLLCIKTTSIDATPPSGAQIQVAPSTNMAYSNFGMLIYQPGYTSNGVGTIARQINSFPWNNPSNNFLDGALNRAGVWGATAVPDNQPIGFSIPFTVPSTKTYIVAIAGDNMGQIGVDGVTLITQDPAAMYTSIVGQLPVYSGQGIAVAFKFWHGYPVTLQAGTHYLNVQGINQGGPAGFAAEIYDATADQLQAAQLVPAYVASPGTFPNNTNFYSNVNMIFSTRYARLGTFTSGINNAYSCPANYGLDPTQAPPQCVLTQTQSSSQNEKQWASVAVTSTKLSVVVATLNNVIGQTFQGIPVPYYAPVPGHVDCGGMVQTYLNGRVSGTKAKNDCPDAQVGSTVTYIVQAGRYMATSPDAAATLASNDVFANTQAYANAHGNCQVQ